MILNLETIEELKAYKLKKLDLTLKPELLESIEELKAYTPTYIEMLKDFDLEFNEDVDTLLDQYADMLFTEMMKTDKILKMKKNGYKDKNQFKKDTIIQYNLRKNDTLVEINGLFLEKLKNVKRFIGNFSINENYTVKFMIFAGCEYDLVIDTIIQSRIAWNRMCELSHTNSIWKLPNPCPHIAHNWLVDAAPEKRPPEVNEDPAFHIIVESETITIESIING